MKIAYFSDIHLEILFSSTRRLTEWESYVDRTLGRDPYDPHFNALTFDRAIAVGPDLRVLPPDLDVLILAGDIARIAEHRSWFSSIDYARACQRWLGCPVVLVPGNHEYYGLEFYSAREAALSESHPGVYVLDRGEVILPISGPTGLRHLRVLGATLWTDYAALNDVPLAMHRAEGSMRDHYVIRVGEGRWRATDALEQFNLSRAWLETKLQEAVPSNTETIIVSHHAPHQVCSHPHFGGDALEPCFISNRDDLVELAGKAGARAWIYGHNHWSADATVHSVLITSAQLGYQHEVVNWTGPKILEI